MVQGNELKPVENAGNLRHQQKDFHHSSFLLWKGLGLVPGRCRCSLQGVMAEFLSGWGNQKVEERFSC